MAKMAATIDLDPPGASKHLLLVDERHLHSLRGEHVQELRDAHQLPDSQAAQAVVGQVVEHGGAAVVPPQFIGDKHFVSQECSLAELLDHLVFYPVVGCHRALPCACT